jgi:hypothetical protein
MNETQFRPGFFSLGGRLDTQAAFRFLRMAAGSFFRKMGIANGHVVLVEHAH